MYRIHKIRFQRYKNNYGIRTLSPLFIWRKASLEEVLIAFERKQSNKK